jgi:hypothetical protein
MISFPLARLRRLNMARGKHGTTERPVGIERDAHGASDLIIGFELACWDWQAVLVSNQDRVWGARQTKFGPTFQIRLQRLAGSGVQCCLPQWCNKKSAALYHYFAFAQGADGGGGTTRFAQDAEKPLLAY